MRPHLLVSCLGLLFAPLLSGCGEKAEPMKRDAVSKVTGTVLIDGKAEPAVAVRLARADGAAGTPGSPQTLMPSAFTDAAGKFSIGTYDKGAEGDGAPNGKYVLIFQWGTFNLLGGGRYEGDKFNGKYADPKKSEFKVEVAGQPVEVPTIDLDTKDLPKVKLLPGATEAIPSTER